MKRRLIKAIKGESGQALPIVLVLLLLGGLLIAPSLSYASTSLNAGQIVEKNVKGLYAADAGVEYVLWQITNSIPPPEQQQLPDVNQMQVSIETDIIGTYTLYMGKLIDEAGTQYDRLGVYGEAEVIGEDVIYTITLIRLKDPEVEIKLSELGVMLPLGYTYVNNSAASFPQNLSTANPTSSDYTPNGAQWLNWEWSPPFRRVLEDNVPETQRFRIVGTGGLDGDYAWARSQTGAIGTVGEVIGKLYRITATATNPEDGEITVVADAMWYAQEEEITILLWQINPQ